jgi:C4-dicarboxylate-specific signal transduction histidine kinase
MTENPPPRELSPLVLDSMGIEIAVLDGDGALLSGNAAWKDSLDASEALRGIQAVLAGESPAFQHVYASADASESRWFLMSVLPLGGGRRGAVVLHTDITEMKQAEALVKRQQAELVYITRINTMGELAAAMAHEIHQPLTAVSVNAGVALRLLSAGNLESLEEILGDIVGEARRAGEIVHHMNDLMRKREPDSIPLDFNEAIRALEVFAKAEATQRNASFHLELEAGLPAVNGDRIQLQQVLLNLIHNGFEAMENVEGPRELVVRSLRGAGGGVVVEVRDAGPAPDPATFRRMFEPFYTTKPGGLGMGLSIGRSIVESHGGRIWAEPNPERGITVRFALPPQG